MANRRRTLPQSHGRVALDDTGLFIATVVGPDATAGYQPSIAGDAAAISSLVATAIGAASIHVVAAVATTRAGTNPVSARTPHTAVAAVSRAAADARMSKYSYMYKS